MNQEIVNVIAGIFRPYDYESITVADTAIGLTAGKYQNSNGHGVKTSRVIITVETAQVRYRVDGTSPTSSEGHILGVGYNLTLIGDDAIKNFKAIRTGGTSGVLKVTYEQ